MKNQQDTIYKIEWPFMKYYMGAIHLVNVGLGDTFVGSPGGLGEVVEVR